MTNIAPFVTICTSRYNYNVVCCDVNIIKYSVIYIYIYVIYMYIYIYMQFIMLEFFIGEF